MGGWVAGLAGNIAISNQLKLEPGLNLAITVVFILSKFRSLMFVGH